MAQRKLKYIFASLITVNRDSRQRTELENLDDLANSIRKLGVLNPITVTHNMELVAGERRLEACKLIDPEYKIPALFLEELTESELQLIELDENIKREKLEWKDEVKAYSSIYKILIQNNPDMSVSQVAEYIGCTPPVLYDRLKVNDALEAGMPAVLAAPGISAAVNILERQIKRQMDNELNNLIETATRPATLSISQGDEPLVPGQLVKIEVPEPHFQVADFNEWAATYTGKKFNLLHCDFPYGINHGKSEQGGTKGGTWTGYDDSEDVYWKLCDTLCDYVDKILHPSAHIIFWLSMKHFRATVDFFEKNLPEAKINPYPLIWLKSDGKGIVSDVNRSPRNVYEAALFMSLGDRQILTPIHNACSFPTQKNAALHVSEKPVPMLKHFFRMVCDSNTELLDPTCGGGSSIRAAKLLKAKRALGLDLNPDFISAATDELRTSTNLAALQNGDEDE